jgi:RNA polymerase sigma factor (sigma-70 family)
MSNVNYFPQGMPLASLLERVHAGCPEAARVVYERYSHHILRVVRRRYLPPGSLLRRECDSTDLTQEAWASVYDLVRRGKTFSTEADFIHFIVAVTRNHFLMHYRAHVKCQSHSLEREKPLALAHRAALAVGPDPAKSLAAEDEWQHLLKGLPNEQQQLLAAVHDGDRLAEAASRLGVGLRTAQRFVRTFRLLWMRRHQDDG